MHVGAPHTDSAVSTERLDTAFASLTAAVDDDDLEAALRVVRAHWFELLYQRREAVRLLLDRVPPSRLRAAPLLTMLLGACYATVPHRRARTVRLFATFIVTTRRWSDADLDPIDLALVRASESAAFRLIGRRSLAVGPGRAALRALDGLTETQRAEIGSLPRVYSQVGLSLYYGGDTAAALGAFARGLAESSETPPSSGFGNVAMLAGIHALRGDLAEARRYVEHGRTDLWTDEQRDQYTGVFYRIAEALLALEALDPVGADHHLRRIRVDRRIIEHWISIAETEAVCGLLRGAPGEALANLDAAVAARGGDGRSPAARRRLSRVRGLLHLALGNPEAAAAIAHRDAPSGPLGSAERARADLALGKTGTALSDLAGTAGAELPPRLAVEAAVTELAVLLRYPPGPRVQGAARHLGAVLERTEQRLPLAYLAPHDHARVLDALAGAGYGELVRDAPPPLLADTEPDEVLSSRELAVLAELMRTSSVPEIAVALHVSPNTVKSQLRSIYRKLDVGRREDAVAVAIARHLLIRNDR